MLLDVIIAAVVFLVLAQFIDGRLAFAVGIGYIGIRWLTHREPANDLRRAVDDAKRLGVSPEELMNLSREEAVERLASAQQECREALLQQGVDVQAIAPEIGRHIPWTDVVRQVFRVLEFDRGLTTVGANQTVKLLDHSMPYGYLLVESPILNQPARLPITHRVDFLLAASVFDMPELAELAEKEELLVTYAPKRGVSGSVLHRIHYVITPRGTLDRYYTFGNDLHMAKPAPEKLFGKFVYLPREFSVNINSNPVI